MTSVGSPDSAADARRLRWSGLGLILLSGLTACSTQQPGARQAFVEHHHYAPGRYYPPPGPASDPWGPYIHEASGRFGVPESWIRAVMRQESGGHEDVISWAGAMGLMQVMPETYDGLRTRYELGDDPFDPHNNILAGTAYLREMYDRYGSPGFLAAYNAGPNRVDRYLTGGEPLPIETVNYVASIAPRLGGGTPMSGPLAVYAGNAFGGGAVRVASRTSSGCDPDAAYDPDRPCVPLAAPVVQPAVLETVRAPTPGYCDQDAAYDPARPCQPQVVRAPTPGYCDQDAAYDPARPCQPPPAAPVAVAFAEPSRTPAAVEAAPLEPPSLPPYRPTMAPVHPPLYAANEPAPRPYRISRPIQETMAQRVAYRPIVPPAYRPPAPAHWSIQVGAYGSLSAAAAAADNARTLLPEARDAKIELLPTAPLGNHVAFRAQISGFTPAAASHACARITGQGLPCMPVPPQAS